MRKLLSMIVFVLAICSSFEVMAQSRTLTGKIEAPDGTAIVGATVLIPGTQVGALTGAEGEFTLEAPDGSESILVKYIGYEESILPITDSDEFSITLSPTDLTLEEVVVTAFGLERDKKALGYSVQEVDASELTEARSTNVVNSLSGRVAGIQITGASGVGGGSQVTIRGNASILGNNQPQRIWLANYIIRFNHTALQILNRQVVNPRDQVRKIIATIIVNWPRQGSIVKIGYAAQNSIQTNEAVIFTKA